jgi:hypothetical protein
VFHITLPTLMMHGHTQIKCICHWGFGLAVIRRTRDIGQNVLQSSVLNRKQ